MTRLIISTVMTLLAMQVSSAQSLPGPEFEVASVRPSKPFGPGNTRGGVEAGHGKLTIANYALRESIRWAYDVKSYQISGLSRIITDRYDIIATAPPNTPDEQLRKMLQSLLADRFKLALHREEKEFPVYVLVALKGGSKLRGVKDDRPAGGNFTWGRLSARLTVAQLADYLSSRMDRPVLDRTAINGIFDIALNWTPDAGQEGKDQPPDPNDPSIFTAVQEQLGLRMETQKAPIEVLVIDRVEKPSEN